jgi:hypothetical protein
VSSRVRAHVPTWIPGTGDVRSLKWATHAQSKVRFLMVHFNDAHSYLDYLMSYNELERI